MTDYAENLQAQILFLTHYHTRHKSSRVPTKTHVKQVNGSAVDDVVWDRGGVTGVTYSAVFKK
jgi:hypothetical protein